MEKISEFLGKIIELLLYILMILLVCLTFLQVFCRFVIRLPVSWSQEVVKLCFVWIIFLGAAIAVRENTHLCMDIFTAHLPSAAQKVTKACVFVLSLICVSFMFCGGVEFCIQCASKRMMTLPLPANILYAAMPVSAALMLWYFIEKVWRYCTKRKEKK